MWEASLSDKWQMLGGGFGFQVASVGALILSQCLLEDFLCFVLQH
jgi:hypothetical protein